MGSLAFDPFGFCQRNESRSGDIPVARLARLREEAVSPDGNVHWSLSGSIDNLGNPRLLLEISGTVRLMCQRCLTPFDFDLSSDAILVVAKDEASADHVEELLSDEDLDVIVAEKELDIVQLVEDEALLGIPLSPRHETCPDGVQAGKPSETGKAPSPFEALKNWKQ